MDFPRRRSAVGWGEVERGRLASVGFEISPALRIDQRRGRTGSPSLIYSSTVAPEDGFALSDAGAGQADGPISLSVPPCDRTMTHTGTSRVSTPAPELVVIDFFTPRAIQPHHHLATAPT